MCLLVITLMLNVYLCVCVFVWLCVCVVVCLQLRLMRLLQRLPASVVRRVHRERHAAPSWITPVPECQRLTDGDLQEFTRSITGAALLAMFRYCSSGDVNRTNN